MSKTVNSAFKQFLKDIVNLDSNQTKIARNSRDYLLSNIDNLNIGENFFDLASDFNLKYGSFARKTKTRPLDDIDLMVGLSGYGFYYHFNNDSYLIKSKFDNENLSDLITDGYLNSRKVIEKFKLKLGQISNYQAAEIHRNKQAITLQLKSYTWNFDIVPCFYTVNDFYLIPNGEGEWEKTDPRIDNERTTRLNQKFEGHLLDLIRLVKYINSVREFSVKIPSYLLETIILNYYENNFFLGHWNIDEELSNIFSEISNSISNDIEDPKHMQGNINSFSLSDRLNISLAFSELFNQANEAVFDHKENRELEALNIWYKIFGEAFPL